MGNNKQKLTHSEVLRIKFGYKEAEMEEIWRENGANARGGIRRRSDITTLSANRNKRKCSLTRPLSCGYFRDPPVQFWCLE